MQWMHAHRFLSFLPANSRGCVDALSHCMRCSDHYHEMLDGILDSCSTLRICIDITRVPCHQLFALTSGRRFLGISGFYRMSVWLIERQNSDSSLVNGVRPIGSYADERVRCSMIRTHDILLIY